MTVTLQEMRATAMGKFAMEESKATAASCGAPESCPALTVW